MKIYNREVDGTSYWWQDGKLMAAPTLLSGKPDLSVAEDVGSYDCKLTIDEQLEIVQALDPPKTMTFRELLTLLQTWDNDMLDGHVCVVDEQSNTVHTVGDTGYSLVITSSAPFMLLSG